MKKSLTLLIFILLSINCLTAQSNASHICATTEYMEQLSLLYPDEISSEIDFESWMNLKVDIQRQKRLEIEQKNIQPPIRIIPIIFHVITDGTGNDNINANLIYAQLDQLNDDFRRQNSDAGSTLSMFQGVAADCEIEFCLALVDENGNTLAEPGIMRWTNFGDGPFAALGSTIENTIKPQTIQNPNVFLNFWIMDIGNDTGYAQFPSNSGLPGLSNNGGAALSDGVVLNYITIGSLSNPNPINTVFRYGRIGTHEIGHYLGLRHIWGDGNCSASDFCADTPDSDAFNLGCQVSHVSCSTTDMIQNYMDYSDDICSNLFTQDQRLRMDVVLANSPRRPFGSGVVPTVCNPTVACNTNLNLNNTEIGIADYESMDWIKSSATLQNGAKIDYDATTYVELNPGFTVNNGAIFNAFINGCNNGNGGVNLNSDTDIYLKKGWTKKYLNRLIDHLHQEIKIADK